LASFTKDSTVSILYSIISLLVGIIYSIVIARSFGPAGKGEIAILLLAPSILLTFGNMGVNNSIVYFLGKKKYELPEVVGGLLSFSFILGAMLLAVFAVLYIFAYDIFFLNTKPFLLLPLVLILPIQLLAGYYQMVFLGLKKVILYSLLAIFNTFLSFGLLILMIFGFKLGIAGVVMSVVLSNILFLVIVLVFVSRLAGLSFRLNRALIKDYLIYGIIAHIGNAAMYLTYRSDMFLVNYFLTLVSVGLYSLGVSIAELLLIFAGSIALVLFPRIASMGKGEGGKETAKVARNVMFLAFVGSIGLVVIGKYLIQLLYGRAFLPAYGPFLILLPGIIVLSGSKILATYISGKGKPHICAMISILALALNVSLNICFIPLWGIRGAAFSSTLAYSVHFLLFLTAFTMLSKEKVIDVLFIKLEDKNFYLDLIKKFKKARLPIEQAPYEVRIDENINI
jgi:O-antigen/teichoic acid export membrane protein